MTPSQFVPILTRGAGDSTVSPTAEEAARRRFLEQVEKVDDTLQFVADRDHAAEVVTSKTLSLRLFDETGRHLKTLRASVPEAARDPQAWFLLLPSLTLRSVDLPSGSLSVIWEISLADRGCASFTYHVDGEYEATRGMTFSLEKLT